jgi:twitching motility protein PilT
MGTAVRFDPRRGLSGGGAKRETDEEASFMNGRKTSAVAGMRSVRQTGVHPRQVHEPTAAETQPKQTTLSTLLLVTKKVGASDLHLSAGAPVMIRVSGEMKKLPLPGQAPDTAMSAEEIKRMIYSVLTEAQQQKLEETHELDFSMAIGDQARFRGNVMFQLRGLAGVFRVIPTEIKGFDELKLPAAVRQLAQKEKGLVLVTGPTGSGKSTTLAAMVDWINTNRDGHIITIEDPIEFVHQPKRCMINQREVGSGTYSFANALRSSLREDPDVILVGELRDLETIALAITAAETGHLVFGTLHTMSAPKTIDRLINVFPAGEQAQIRAMLAESLSGVVAQMLLAKIGGGRVAAHEILISTHGVRSMIREGKTHMIPNAIQTGGKLGMQSLENELNRLAETGVIEANDAASALGEEFDEEPSPPTQFSRAAPMSSVPRPAAVPQAPAPAAAAGDGVRRASPYKYS